MKSRVFPSGAVLMVIGVAVASFALWQSLRAWEEQKADKLSDFSAAERQVEAMQQDARSVSDDPAGWTLRCAKILDHAIRK